jgi:hypothetical protein
MQQAPPLMGPAVGSISRAFAVSSSKLRTRTAAAAVSRAARRASSSVCARSSTLCETVPRLASSRARFSSLCAKASSAAAFSRSARASASDASAALTPASAWLRLRRSRKPGSVGWIVATTVLPASTASPTLASMRSIRPATGADTV